MSLDIHAGFGANSPAGVAVMPSPQDFPARMPIRVDVAALTMMDRVLVRNYLRQIAAKHGCEFIPVDGQDAEVSIDYVGERVRICAGTVQELLTHPLRITQVDAVLQRFVKPAPAAVARESRAARPSSTVSALLLPATRQSGPLRISGHGFGELYFDRHFRFVWSPMEAESLHAALAASQDFRQAEPIAEDAFNERLKAGDLHSVSVESLCWSMDTGAALAGGEPMVGEDQLVRLSNWPNLAWMPDFESWLPVLVTASVAPIRWSELRQRLVAQGIAPERVAEKLQLLAIFGRIERVVASEQLSMNPAPAEAALSASASVLGRLRARLRAMLAKPQHALGLSA